MQAVQAVRAVRALKLAFLVNRVALQPSGALP